MSLNATELIESAWRQRAEHLERCLSFLISTIGTSTEAVGDGESKAIDALHQLLLFSVALDLEAPISPEWTCVLAICKEDPSQDAALSAMRLHVRNSLKAAAKTRECP